jgi:prepilin-type N-terminal cleavage/methylation domain-containing protein
MVTNPMTKRARRARGMTMMEVMIALAIATVGLLGALAMLGTLFRGAAQGRAFSEAMTLAQSKLEAEVSRGPISLVTPASTTTTEAAMDALGRTTGSGPFDYTRSTTWSVTTDNLRRKVAVTVTFTDSGGATHPLTVERERNLP